MVTAAITQTRTEAQADERRLRSEMYEVDNRYPEIMPLYAKVRGGKSYGALHGAAGINRAQRASRINNLKRNFWTAAAAVVAVLALMVSGGEDTPPAQSFLPPTLEIVSAAQSLENPDELLYTYEVQLNDADAVDVSITAITEDGEILGTAGPYYHEVSGVSEQRTMTVSRPVGLTKLKLELSATYYRDGESYELNAEREVPLREEVPQPVTEATEGPSPGSSESVEPAAPALSIVSCEINGSNVSPLRYRYEAALTGIETMEVTSEIRDEAGNLLGTDGPWTHSQTETSPERETALEWENRPVEITLTLTGSYTENGEEKRLTSSQTLAVPEEPFTAPTLSVTDATLQAPEGTPLRWQYELQLNSAESLEVTAQMTDENGNALASDGPFLHTASESSPERETALDWETRPETITLTLTGSYTEEGETKTVTASQTVAVPAEPFTAPTLTISNATLNGSEITPLSYHYRVRLNSAESLQVRAVITAGNGGQLGTDGPYSHNKSETSPTRRAVLRWNTRPSSVILTLTGSYTENGTVKTVTASRTLQVPTESFTPPTLTISTAALNGTDAKQLNYSYLVRLNSAASMEVRATISSNTGAGIGSGGPYTHSKSGSSANRSAALNWTTRPTSVTLTLTGTYTQNGATKTVTASQRLTVPAEPFTAPTLNLVNATLNGSNVTPLSYSYRVNLNSASSMIVRASITSETGASLGSGGPYSHTTSGNSPTRSAALSWTTRPTRVTLTLTGTYTQNGSAKTVTATQTLNVPAEPFTAPTLAIANAALDGDAASSLSYSARVTLNSAANLQIRAAVTANGGASLGTDGPFTQSSSGTSANRTVALSWTTRPASVTLTLTGTYTENGTSKTVTATQTLNVPFTAPTLSIASMALTENDLTPLTYSYQVTLNSAQSMQVSAAITSDLGESLGADGAYNHTASGTSPTRSVDLDWENWPGTVTLTLTGTYTENGTTKTVTASRTLEAPAKPFEDPALEIKTALSIDDSSMVLYNYIVTLNDATELQVNAEISYEVEIEDDVGNVHTETRTALSEGPFTHIVSETSETHLSEISIEYFTEYTLTLTGTYQNDAGETKTITVSKVLERFTEPEITVTEARRDPSDPEKIIYSAEILLNDVERLSVEAELTEEMTVFGTDGPIEIEASQTLTGRVIDAPDTADRNLTLWLSGTYEIEDEPFEIWAFKDVEKLFTAPTISIDSMTLDPMDTSPLTYVYSVELNSAESISVSADVTLDNGSDSWGSDGPYVHSVSETSPAHNIDLDWSDYPETLTLTLTGSYEENGETKTVTAARTIEVPPQFTEPVITILSAEFDRSFPDEWIVVYTVQIELNSADSLELRAELAMEPDVYGSDGPITVTSSQTLSNRRIQCMDDMPYPINLEVIGTYERDGVSCEITAVKAVDEGNFFEEPSLSGSAERGSTDSVVVYSFNVYYQSAGYLDVTAEFYNASDVLIHSEPALHCDSDDSFGPFTVDTGETADYMVLRGSYEYLGESHEISSRVDLPAVQPFTDPSFSALNASLNDFEELADAQLSYSCRLSMGDASLVTVNVTVTTDTGVLVGTVPDREFSDSGVVSGTIPLTLPETASSVTVTVTGVYSHNGTQSISVSATVVVTMSPDSFDSGGEVYVATDSPGVVLEYWAEFWPRAGDPHTDSYDFAVTALIAYWYDAGGNLLSISSVTDNPDTDVTVDHADCYSFQYTGTVQKPEAAVSCQIQINIRDRASGKEYTATTDHLEIE